MTLLPCERRMAASVSEHSSVPAEAGDRTLSVLGTPLLLTSYAGLFERCNEWARRDGATVIDFTNTHIVTMRRHDPGFHRLTEGFDFFVPDGMPLIWCLNMQRAGLKDRVYGPTFMRRALLAAGGQTHYFLGGSEECVKRLAAAFCRQNTGLRIAGTHHGYFAREEEDAIIDELNRLSPEFIWVGLGTPKQQEWIQRNRARIRRGVILAVGFAFDVNAGTKKDAPAWMQRAGLTWLYRLASEPRRLLGRYLKYNLLFLSYLLWDGIRGKAFGAPGIKAA